LKVEWLAGWLVEQMAALKELLSDVQKVAELVGLSVGRLAVK
jgi:hypothetical protein